MNIPDMVYSAVFEFVWPIFAVPVGLHPVTGLIGGMGNNGLTAPAAMSSDLLNPVF